MIKVAVVFFALVAQASAINCNYAILEMKSDEFSARILNGESFDQEEIKKSLSFLKEKNETKIKKYKPEKEFDSLEVDQGDTSFKYFSDLCRAIYAVEEKDIKTRLAIHLLLERVWEKMHKNRELSAELRNFWAKREIGTKIESPPEITPVTSHIEIYFQSKSGDQISFPCGQASLESQHPFSSLPIIH